MNDATQQSQPDLSIGSLIGQVRSQLWANLERALARDGYGISASQFLALKYLAIGGPQTATELARTLGYDAGALTRLLVRLEQKGYVRRERQTRDRRALSIGLTEAGQRLWSDIRACAEGCIDAALAGLDADERAQFVATLRRLLDTLRRQS